MILHRPALGLCVYSRSLFGKLTIYPRVACIDLWHEVLVRFRASLSAPLTAQAEEFLGTEAKMLQAAAPLASHPALQHFSSTTRRYHNGVVTAPVSIQLERPVIHTHTNTRLSSECTTSVIVRLSWGHAGLVKPLPLDQPIRAQHWRLRQSSLSHLFFPVSGVITHCIRSCRARVCA